MNSDVLLKGQNLTKVFGYGKNKHTAVDNVNFSIREGEIVSIVGESGSGKTTLAKIMLGLLKPTSGSIMFRGNHVDVSSFKARKAYWRQVQAIFQDPFASFNQFRKVERMLEDCLILQGEILPKRERFKRMQYACRFVNLRFEELYSKYPFELSGGQMQRLMIARIFMMNPSVVIADEPTSMVDACSRSTILDMLLKLRDENRTTIVFITHDLGLAYYVSDTIYIMEKGKIVEAGNAQDVVLNPKCEYTKQLLRDVPKLHEPWDLSS